jgi:signal transduction histidine kinase
MNSRLFLRLTAPVTATSLLLLAVGVGTAWYVHRLQQTLNDALLDNASSMRAAEELEILLHEVRTKLDHFLITGDREYLKEAAGFRKDTDHWLSEAERWSGDPREKSFTKQARAGHGRFYDRLDGLLAEAPEAALPQKVRALIDEVLSPEILQPTHSYLDFNEEEVAHSVRDNQLFASRLIWGLLLLGICGSGAGLAAGFGFARTFKRSLIQLSMPIRDAAGQLGEVVGPVTLPSGGDLHELEAVLRVVAQRIRAVIERLRRSEREVLHSEQLAALGQMAAAMAHELRNPLTSMKMLVQAAQEENYSAASDIDGPSESASGPCLSGRDLAVFEDEISRLEKLIQSFLDFARPPHATKKVADVRALVEQAVGLVSGRAARIGARIVYSPPAEAVWSEVDADQVRQVLFNLLLNALEALRRGGVVGVALEKEADGGLSLRVTDDGCGLPAGLGERIFAPFITTKETGLGLGLSVCKRIIEAHGGAIAAANRAEGGAVFTVRLPPPSASESRENHAETSRGG